MRIVRAWSGHPYSMLQILHSEFAAVVMLGHHSPIGTETNPLAHTLTPATQRTRLNGPPASQFLLHTMAASTLGVPVGVRLWRPRAVRERSRDQ